MMSFTVTCSRSRILTSMLRCLRGIRPLDSLTMVRSSSCVSASSLDASALNPNNDSKLLVIALIAQTNGMMSFISGSKITLAGKATFSGCRAAMVLGVISAKIKITIVSVIVAIAMPASPYRRMATTVAIADARILTRLLPIRMRPINRSGRASNLPARSAPL